MKLQSNVLNGSNSLMLLCCWLLVVGTGRYATSDEGLEPSSSVVVFWVQCIIHLYGMFNPQNTVVLDVPGTWYGTSVVSKYLVRASVYRYYCFCCWWWCGGCCVVVGTHTHTTLACFYQSFLLYICTV